MSHHVRPRGRRWELRVKHRLLPRPYYDTFDTQVDAENYGEQLDAMLDRGVLPTELQASAPGPAADPHVMAVVRAYLAGAPHLTPSDDKLLASLLPELATVRLSAVSYRWAGEWVRTMKLQQRLAPGTIRKRVGVLARVLDWHLATHAAADSAAPVNPLRLLARGYSQYTAAERQALERQGHQARHDQHRDRRMLPAEEAAIRAALAGHKRPDRERPWADGGDPAFALLFDVLVGTGLRLREAYRLRVDQVDTVKGVLRVEGSKAARGQVKPRVVPLQLHLRTALASWCAERVGLLWPYWDGTPGDLDRATRRLSARFSSLFAYAQVQDLTEHDLRHEATCRWFELRDAAGRWVFSDVEVARIMGWSNLAMALRYAAMRGEDLAARLG
jgi:integrase